MFDVTTLDCSARKLRSKETRTKQMDYSDFVLVDTGSTREEKLMSMY